MIGIKGFDKIPDICQKCPCFTTYVGKEQLYDVVVQLCNATKLPITKAWVCSNTTEEWFHTKRPEWCPLYEINEETKCCITEDEYHRSVAGLSDW